MIGLSVHVHIAIQTLLVHSGYTCTDIIYYEQLLHSCMYVKLYK